MNGYGKVLFPSMADAEFDSINGFLSEIRTPL